MESHLTKLINEGNFDELQKILNQDAQAFEGSSWVPPLLSSALTGSKPSIKIFSLLLGGGACVESARTHLGNLGYTGEVNSSIESMLPISREESQHEQELRQNDPLFLLNYYEEAQPKEEDLVGFRQAMNDPRRLEFRKYSKPYSGFRNNFESLTIQNVPLTQLEFSHPVNTPVAKRKVTGQAEKLNVLREQEGEGMVLTYEKQALCIPSASPMIAYELSNNRYSLLNGNGRLTAINLSEFSQDSELLIEIFVMKFSDRTTEVYCRT